MDRPTGEAHAGGAAVVEFHIVGVVGRARVAASAVDLADEDGGLQEREVAGAGRCAEGGRDAERATGGCAGDYGCDLGAGGHGE